MIDLSMVKNEWRSGTITNCVLREETADEARAAATEFADLSDEELLTREAELDQRWDALLQQDQRLLGERRGVKREKSRSGCSCHLRARGSTPRWPNRRRVGKSGPDHSPGGSTSG
ncbi:hypothetical protein ACGFW5_30455 [Streptomyces sp. NPDC048416]|uniref:hypothetical protein n=1 Tax=Streptomyces sp. NPDC048416 TaxID=3365546 RepID=UPI003717EB31